jgi:Domain of unknown function (DUF4349)
MAQGRHLAGAALALLALSGAAGGLAGCSSSSSSSVSAGSTAVPADGGAVLGPSATAGPVSRNAAAPHSGELQAIALRVPSAVIKTASIRLRVAHGKIRPAVLRIELLAARLGGVTGESHVVPLGEPVGTIVIRVPSARFEDAVREINDIGQVRSEAVRGRDVGQQFVDLNARLVNLNAQERVLRRLMSRAQTVAASILVENELSQVQLQIEQVTGQIRYLQNRTSLSTIAVAVGEAGAAPVVHHHASALWKAGRQAVDGAIAVVGAVIVGLGYVIPLALLAAVALAALRLLAPRLPRPATRGDGSADA